LAAEPLLVVEQIGCGSFSRRPCSSSPRVVEPPPGLEPVYPCASSVAPLQLSNQLLSPKVSRSLGEKVFSSFEPGLLITHSALGACSIVWSIGKLRSKLKCSRGFPLLSPIFDVGGLRECRLMFAPGNEWRALPGARQERKRRPDQPHQAFGSLRLKAEPAAGEADASPDSRMNFEVFFGHVGAGRPVECDFSDRGVHSCDLQVDWREHLVSGYDGLEVRVELQNFPHRPPADSRIRVYRTSEVSC